ncbi:MAG: PEP-CTERM sorting domain-containing protein [Bryobacteraceae bacterium]
MSVAVLIAGLVFAASPARSASIYSIDDGVGESGIGGFQSIDVFLNSFQSVSGADRITAVRIAFGDFTHTLPTNGTAITAALYTDPNNDGNPLDAVLVSSVNGVVANSNTDTFVEYVFPSGVTIPIGNWFFIGFTIQNLTGNNLGAERDTSSSAGRSWDARWFTAVSFSLADLSNSTLNNLDSFFGAGQGGNLMIRAVGEDSGAVGDVPEPATIWLGGAGLGLLAAFARKRKSA